MSQPVLSVFILTWNRKDDLAQAIRSVQSQTLQEVEIVVVDSASTDGTTEMLAEKFPEVVHVRLPYNMGVTGGRNMGVVNCSAELIYFLDDDAVFADEHVLQKVVDRFDELPDMWAMVCKVLNAEGSIWRHTVRGIKDPPDTDMVVYNFIGCGSCVRKQAFDELGVFDPVYFREGEELDLSYRIYNHGKFVLYYPDAVVIHFVNTVQRNPAGITMLYRYRNNILTYFKYLPLLDASVYLLWNMLIDGYRMTRMRLPHYYVLANLHLLYMIPRVLLTQRQRISKTALYQFNGLLAFPVHLEEFPQLVEKRATIWTAMRTYLRAGLG